MQGAMQRIAGKAKAIPAQNMFKIHLYANTKSQTLHA